jgi:hypothetical protein
VQADNPNSTVVATLDGRIIDFQRTTGIDPVSQKPMCYGWLLFEGQPLRFETQGESIAHGVQVRIIRGAETGEPENAEYQITVFSPGGGIYLMTQWMGGREKAEGIVQEFSGIYGPDALELVERSNGDAGYRFKTLHRADIWRA